MSQILVRFGTRGIFEGSMKRASKRQCLLALILQNEAEGTRTLNLRIDSPNLRFVSAYGKDVYDSKIKTYETNGKPK